MPAKQTQLPAHEELTDAITTASRAAFEHLRRDRPDDTFYYYVLVTSGVCDRPAPAACSFEGLAHAVAAFRAEYPAHDNVREALEWSHADSPCCLVGDEHFAEVGRLFARFGDPYERDADTLDMLFASMVEAMRSLDEHGFFGWGAARDRIIINVVVPGEECEREMLARARRINPPSALGNYAAAFGG